MSVSHRNKGTYTQCIRAQREHQRTREPVTAGNSPDQWLIPGCPLCQMLTTFFMTCRNILSSTQFDLFGSSSSRQSAGSQSSILYYVYRILCPRCTCGFHLNYKCLCTLSEDVISWNILTTLSSRWPFCFQIRPSLLFPFMKHMSSVALFVVIWLFRDICHKSYKTKMLFSFLFFFLLSKSSWWPCLSTEWKALLVTKTAAREWKPWKKEAVWASVLQAGVTLAVSDSSNRSYYITTLLG